MIELLGTWGPLILGLVGGGGIGGLLKIGFERSLTKATAARQAVEGDAVTSSTWEKWADAADARAKESQAEAASRIATAEQAARTARDEAEASRRAAWAAEDTAARCRRETEDVRDQLSDLLDLVRTCARAECPLRDLMSKFPAKTEPT